MRMRGNIRMIFREKNEKESILIRQHDHGFLAGEIARHIIEDFLKIKYT